MVWLLLIAGYFPFPRLATPRVVAWLAVVFGLSATVAGIESTFFALTTWQFTSNAYASALVGVVWFALTYSLDRVISLSDTSRAATRASALGGLLARCAAIALLFAVAAPQLRYLAVEPEVEHRLMKQRIEARARFLHSVEAELAAGRKQRKQQIAELEHKLTTEIAGRGLSGRHGKGATAESIEAQLTLHRAELTRADVTAAEQLEELKNAPDSQLAAHGVVFPGGGYAERNRVAKQLLQEHSEYGDTANLAKYLVAALFLLLIGAKVMEGPEVQFYLSAHSQSVYAAYLAGSFDEYVAVHDRPSHNPMSAPRFVAWIKANPQLVENLNHRANGCDPLSDVELRQALREEEQRVEEDIGQRTKQLDQVLRAEVAGERKLSLLERQHVGLREARTRVVEREYDIANRRSHAGASASELQSLLLTCGLELRALDESMRAVESQRTVAGEDLRRVRDDRGLLERRLCTLEHEREAVYEVRSRLRARKCEAWTRLADAAIVMGTLAQDEAPTGRVLQ